MILKSLHLTNFRNYERLDFRPERRLNILRGPNAQGKTNLLEAIYMLSTTRPLRTSRENEVITWNAKSALIHGCIEREGIGEMELEIALNAGERKVGRINGVTAPRLIDMIGRLNSVIFSAQDLAIVRGDPSDRRRFLDLEISQMRPRYTLAYAHFRRALEQRTELLRRHAEGRGSLAGLEVWDQALAKYGAQVMQSRWEFLQRLSPMADQAHAELTDGGENLQLRYQPNVPMPEEPTEATVQECFEEAIEARRNDELRRGATLVGPQRDDLSLLIAGREAKTFGSQGQQRTAVLSLKLAEAKLALEEVGEPPVVLLDDVMSDLDDRRKAKVMGFLKGVAQVFITCTDLHSFPPAMLEEAAVYSVAASRVTRE